MLIILNVFFGASPINKAWSREGQIWELLRISAARSCQGTILRTLGRFLTDMSTGQIALVLDWNEPQRARFRLLALPDRHV